MIHARKSARRDGSPGQRLRAAMRLEKPLQVAGGIHAYAAILAEDAGFRALYLSGAGVANASYGVPDIGLTTLDDVLVDLRRITRRRRACRCWWTQTRLGKSTPHGS
jgi:2-methylisocitrate lyase-like PEP mutase family enzyme